MFKAPNLQSTEPGLRPSPLSPLSHESPSSWYWTCIAKPTQAAAPIPSLRDRLYYVAHCLDEDTEPQRSDVLSAAPHGWYVRSISSYGAHSLSSTPCFMSPESGPESD